MYQLRRRLASLWNTSQRDGEGDRSGTSPASAADASDPQHNRQNNLASNISSSQRGHAREREAAAAAAGTAGGAAMFPHGTHQEKVDDISEGDGKEEEPLLSISLAYPWGTSNPRPPPGWSSAASSQTYWQRQPQGNGNDERPVPGASTATAVACYYSPARTTGRVAEKRGGRSRIDEPQRSSSMKRQRGDFVGNMPPSSGRKGGADGGPLEQGENDQQQLQKAARRRRTCPADSTFVSPAHTNRSVSALYTRAEVDAYEQGELELHRTSPPSRLIFRAGFMRVLRGSRAAAATAAGPKRAKPATKKKQRRRSRGLYAMLARQAFHATHEPAPVPEGEGDERADGPVGDDGGWPVASVRIDTEEEEVRRRVRRLEEEQEAVAEERAAARVRRFQALRAESRITFGNAQDAHAQLVASVSAALDAATGPDMATLRDLFGVGVAAAAGARFKDDPQVSHLHQRYVALEALLQGIAAAETAGDLGELERLLSSEGAGRLQNAPEFISGLEALRTGKERAEKYQADKAAGDARVAAAATAAAAADAAATAVAVAAAQTRAQDVLARAAVQSRDAAAAVTAAAAAAPAATERGTREGFLEHADALMIALEERRGSIDEILTSADPEVKRLRMGFKKSYQGCLNKLSSAPSTVSQVVHDIHDKALAPLRAAKSHGWEDRAKGFLYFNLAEKLVGYSERDHFSAESYRMAFPLACVAVDLMAEHSDLSGLFLGKLYSRCPSAVPDVSFDTAGKSDEEVVALLGKEENEDMPAFLSRTKGLVVLMAAIMQTPASGGRATAHPLPLAEGWRWLARFVNGLAAYVKQGNPTPIPAGPALEWFLKVAGYEMQRRYGRAFDKVVQTIKTEILPALLPKAMVPHLLDVMLEDYESRGRRFLPPAGRERGFRAWGDT